MLKFMFEKVDLWFFIGRIPQMIIALTCPSNVYALLGTTGKKACQLNCK